MGTLTITHAINLDLTAPVIDTFSLGTPAGETYPVTLNLTEADSLPVTVYGVIDLTSAGAPSAAQIQLGHGADDLAAEFSFNFSRSTDGTDNVDFGTLAAGDYTVYIVVVDSAATPNVSTVSSDTFTVAATVPADILALYSSGETGGVWDFTGGSDMYTDTGGTTPVSSFGQSLGRIDDISGQTTANNITISAENPTYEDGHILFADSVIDNIFSYSNEVCVAFAAEFTTESGNGYIMFGNNTGSERFYSQRFNTELNTRVGSLTDQVDPLNTGTTFTSVVVGDSDASPLGHHKLHRYNGADQERAFTTSITTGTIKLGRADFASGAINAKIYGLLILDRSPTAGEITSIESYLDGLRGA